MLRVAKFNGFALFLVILVLSFRFYTKFLSPFPSDSFLVTLQNLQSLKLNTLQGFALLYLFIARFQKFPVQIVYLVF
jgi:hypothetical protein